MNEELHEAIQEDNDLEANRIMQDLYMRWFAFGLGLGIVVTCVFFVTLGWYQNLLNL